MVESNSNRVSDPSVFKTVLGPAQITLRYSYNRMKSFPYTWVTYSNTGFKSFSYKTTTSGLAFNFANHYSFVLYFIPNHVPANAPSNDGINIQ